MIDILVGFALLASAITSNKIVLCFLQPTFFVAIRMLAAGTMLAIASAISGVFLGKNTIRHWLHEHATIMRSYGWRFFFISIAITVIPSLCKAYALSIMPSYKMAALGSLDPFITAIYAYILFGERLTKKRFAGIVCGLIGMSILIASTTPLESVTNTWWILSYAEIAMLLAVATGRYGWTLGQVYLKKQVIKPLEFNAYIMIFGGLISAVMTIFEGPSAYTMIKPVTGLFWATMAYTIIIGNGFAYTMYAQVLKRYSASLVSLASLSVPLFVSFFGYIFLQEIPSLYFFGALLLFAIGLLVLYRDEKIMQKNAKRHKLLHK